MIRRLLFAIPVLALLACTSLLFLAARAPRTWAAHWSAPTAVASAGGQNEYGAAGDGESGWDLLWYDDEAQMLKYTRAPRPGVAETRVVQAGDIQHPTLLRVGRHDVGVWVNNLNGRTELMGMSVTPGGIPHVVRLLSDLNPMEHPYLFAGLHGRANLIFSAQLHGNFDDYLVSLDPSRLGAIRPVQLTHSEFYSFYPRAVTDAHGVVNVVHLESCCRQEVWKLNYDRYTMSGRHLGHTATLYQIVGFRNQVMLPQWGLDLKLDRQGNIWGAFVGDGGGWVFERRPNGSPVFAPRAVDDLDGLPESLALAMTRTGGYLFWEQRSDLGIYLASRRFSLTGEPVGAAERAVYEAGSQTGPYARVENGRVETVWQSIERGGISEFETAHYRMHVVPTLAQRLGLGLGDPWQEAAVLVVGSLGVATLTTATNILSVLALVLVGLVVLRFTRKVPFRWTLYAIVISLGLFALFVAPGGPILFLDTLPSMGLSPVPFGLLAGATALLSVEWFGMIALRRVEDPYRLALMAFVGVYVFAFVESVVFVQQRLGII